MTTLNRAPLAPLLQRLFAEADASAAIADERLRALSPAERAALIAPGGDYRAAYTRAKDLYLAVSRDTALLLYLLARTSGAQTIVEFGSSFGISTLHLAAALRDNGGGRLISTEFESGKVAAARENVAAAGLADLVEIREGDALQTLRHGLPATIDLVLLDGAKALYPAVLEMVEPRLRPGALIVADNADWSADYLARVRDPKQGYVSLPFAADVELSMWDAAGVAERPL